MHETAALTQQPTGSVKSKCHYAMQKVRRSLFDYLVEGEYIMPCRDAQAIYFNTLKMQSSPMTKTRWSVI